MDYFLRLFNFSDRKLRPRPTPIKTEEITLKERAIILFNELHRAKFTADKLDLIKKALEESK